MAQVEHVTEHHTDIRFEYADLDVLVEALNEFLPETREGDPEGYVLLDELSSAVESMRAKIVGNLRGRCDHFQRRDTEPRCRSDCRRCGHPGDAHDIYGAECWTRPDNVEHPDPPCPCSWYEPDSGGT